MSNLLDDAKRQNPLREHISPEGIEERIVMECRALITETMGGKLRVYVYQQQKNEMTSVGVFEKSEFRQAFHVFGTALSSQGLAASDPVTWMREIGSKLFKGKS